MLLWHSPYTALSTLLTSIFPWKIMEHWTGAVIGWNDVGLHFILVTNVIFLLPTLSFVPLRNLEGRSACIDSYFMCSLSILYTRNTKSSIQWCLLNAYSSSALYWILCIGFVYELNHIRHGLCWRSSDEWFSLKVCALEVVHVICCCARELYCCLCKLLLHWRIILLSSMSNPHFFFKTVILL